MRGRGDYTGLVAGLACAEGYASELLAWSHRAEAYQLTMECEVESLCEESPVASELADWLYAGHVMDVWPCLRKMDYLTCELELLLTDSSVCEADVKELLKAFFEVALYDLSSEGLEARRRIVELLELGLPDGVETGADCWRQQALSKLREVSRRMGGDTWTGEFVTWLRTELPTSLEGQLLLAEPMSANELQEATRRLPRNLWELWRHLS